MAISEQDIEDIWEAINSIAVNIASVRAMVVHASYMPNQAELAKEINESIRTFGELLTLIEKHRAKAK